MTTDVSEFPFVAELPKREKGRVRTLWDALDGFIDLVEQHGPPVGFTMAAKLLGLSRERIYQLADAKKFTVIMSPDGRQVIGAKSLVEFAETERKNGRPLKFDSTVNGKLLIRLSSKDSRK
jgi:hypothetical protein